jgi:hypothetical protein
VLGVLLILFVLEDKGSLSDERTRDFLRQLLGALAEWTMRFRAAPVG